MPKPEPGRYRDDGEPSDGHTGSARERATLTAVITVEDAAFDDVAAMVADESDELAADRKVRAV